MTNISTTTNSRKGNQMFNTQRFIDVTTPRQINNGTQMFLDSNNPGVYYTSHQSGYVRRVITSQTSVTDFNTGTTQSFDTQSTYQINRRCDHNTGNGITSVLLPRLNDRLSRIQEMADKFDRDLEPVTHTNSSRCVMISPRLR